MISMTKNALRCPICGCWTRKVRMAWHLVNHHGWAPPGTWTKEKA